MNEFEGPDYEMTYPCYIYMLREDVPVTIRVGEHRCICLFTDSDLLAKFHLHHLHEQTGQTKGTTKVETIHSPSRAALAQVVDAMMPSLAANSITHIAFDATPNKQVLIASLVDFVEMLERQGTPPAADADEAN